MRIKTSKLPNVGTTIFTVMAELAQQHQAINLAQGFPNFPCDEKLLALVHEAMQKGFNQYAPMAGVLALREQIAIKIEKLYGATYNPETEITVTTGATEAIYDIISAVVQPQDEVIIFEPAYDSYIPAIELNGGKLIPLKLRHPDYRVDWEEVKNAISPKTRLIIFNTPHNPSGTVWLPSDLPQLEALVKDTDILLLSDEVYEHINFDGRLHQSILHYPSLRDRSFAVYSFGKTFHATGWRVGYCVADADLMKEFRKVHQYVTFSITTPVQYGIAEYLKNPVHYTHIHELYEEKRNRFAALMKDSRFSIRLAEGTYFQLADYSQISDEKDTDFAVRLVKAHGVAAIPMSPFYSDRSDYKMIRFCFAKTDETLEAAAEKLCKI